MVPEIPVLDHHVAQNCIRELIVTSMVIGCRWLHARYALDALHLQQQS